MKFWRQLNHGAENGDCFRTCIACLLDLNPADVPNFIEFTANGSEQHRAADSWLREFHGKCLITTVYLNIELGDVLHTQGALNPGVPYMLSGTSRAGCGHTVIGRDDRIIHDPSDSGIVGPLRNLADGNPDIGYWVEYIGVAL